ncbi:hypothetical protein TanjilG_24432 [Lupinus angustifolius]|uniref:Sieve element occlusion N-terminal domain-containing protein n=1 Tax=Lupinus angustifolius TaxID=3871 RepID=A0A394D7X3_LUPAN|nr:hypothetical protein TanjilG_24432 [Lupinus angustifolius]
MANIVKSHRFGGNDLNPLTLSDELILEPIYSTHVHSVTNVDSLKDSLDKVYLNHINGDGHCDRKILYDLVSNIVFESCPQIPITNFKPEFSTLKLISSQMIITRSAANCVHQTTMWILQLLKNYSWDAKVLITLASFSLEYGIFQHLTRVPIKDPVGVSLKLLNQVQSRKVSDDITELVKLSVSVFQHIGKWATWSSNGYYDPENVPSLTEAFKEIPVVVYWTIATLVASTSNLIGFSLGDYKLSEFKYRVSVSAIRESDGIDITLKWKWLWDVLKKVIPGLKIKEDRYIIIYGGSNNKWIQDFTIELDSFKRDYDIKRAEIIIDHYQLGKDDPKKVPSFWIGVEWNKQNKLRHKEIVDCEIQGIANSLFCLKRDPQGWVILSKGSNIKLLGHGEAMYQTVREFQNWKNNVIDEEGLFDIAFKEYYDTKVKEISILEPCSVNFDNYASSVIATITCPNPTCARVMEVTSVNCKCYIQDAPNNYGY